jgi:hypothetical protein
MQTASASVRAALAIISGCDAGTKSMLRMRRNGGFMRAQSSTGTATAARRRVHTFLCYSALCATDIRLELRSNTRRVTATEEPS